MRQLKFGMILSFYMIYIGCMSLISPSHAFAYDSFDAPWLMTCQELRGDKEANYLSNVCYEVADPEKVLCVPNASCEILEMNIINACRKLERSERPDVCISFVGK